MDSLLINLLIIILILALIVYIAQNYLPAPINQIVTLVVAVIAIIFLIRMLVPLAHAEVPIWPIAHLEGMR